jgi:hypothetical protein
MQEKMYNYTERKDQAREAAEPSKLKEEVEKREQESQKERKSYDRRYEQMLKYEE